MTGHPYGADYFEHCCGPLPYERSEPWLSFFGLVADRIVERIAPGTVLDAGCAKGFLVEALRDRGVEAFGVDVSAYAIGEVRDDVKAYCWVGSVTEPLPRDYDLITCIEVLEHLPPEEGDRALDNICAHARLVLFSSSPSDVEEQTHVNVQPPSYWAESFARRSFLRDVDADWSFVAPWAALFERGRSVDETVAAYERRLRRLTEDLELLRRSRALRYAAGARRFYERLRRSA